MRDIEQDSTARAQMIELNIPSDNFLMQGFIYKAKGGQKHPTLLLLHGYRPVSLLEYKPPNKHLPPVFWETVLIHLSPDGIDDHRVSRLQYID